MSDDEDEFRDMGEDDRFVRYAQEGMLNRVEEMVERDSCDPNRPNASDEYALIEAYHYGHTDICNYLLDIVGVDPNVKDQDGDPFLFIMLTRDRPNNLMFKVINHPDLDILETDELGNNSLGHLCASQTNIYPEIVDALLKRGKTDGNDGRIYVNAFNNYGVTALHNLVLGRAPNCVEILEMLMKENINVNVKDHMAPQVFRFHRTPLHLAVISAERRSVETVRMLLNDPRVDVNAEDGTGKTPFLSVHGLIDPEKLAILLTDERISLTQKGPNNRGVFDLLLQPQMGGPRTPQLNRLLYILLAVFLNEGFPLPSRVSQDGYTNLVATSFAELKDLPRFGRANNDKLLDIWDKPSDTAWSMLYLHDYYNGYENLHKWSPDYAKEIKIMDQSFSIDLAIKGLQYLPRKRQPKKREGEPIARLQNKKRKTKLTDLVKQLKF